MLALTERLCNIYCEWFILVDGRMRSIAFSCKATERSWTIVEAKFKGSIIK